MVPGLDVERDRGFAVGGEPVMMVEARVEILKSVLGHHVDVPTQSPVPTTGEFRPLFGV